MNRLTDVTGITLGYAMAGLSYFKEIDISNFEVSGPMSVLSFLIASLLSASVAYKNYQDGKFKQSERERYEKETAKTYPEENRGPH